VLGAQPTDGCDQRLAGDVVPNLAGVDMVEGAVTVQLAGDFVDASPVGVHGHVTHGLCAALLPEGQRLVWVGGGDVGGGCRGEEGCSVGLGANTRVVNFSGRVVGHLVSWRGHSLVSLDPTNPFFETTHSAAAG